MKAEVEVQAEAGRRESPEDSPLKLDFASRLTRKGNSLTGKLAAVALVLLTAGSSVYAADRAAPYDYAPADRGEFQPRETVRVMPDRFLREHDPVTVFYRSERHPSGAGPEDSPEKFVTLRPEHPGEYRWIDGKTLEFRPTIPWPPLRTFVVQAGRKTHRLSTLLSPPVAITPRDGASDLGRIERIVLAFRRQVDPELLARLVTFEISPLPGVDRGEVSVVAAADYSIKAGERKRSGNVPYTFLFDTPLPLGSHIRTVVKLSDEPGLEKGACTYHCETRPEFRMVAAGVPGHLLSIARDGTRYSADQALEMRGGGRIVAVFSSRLGKVSLSDVKSLFTFTPSPLSFKHEVSGRRITVTAELETDRLYRVVLHPVSIRDRGGRRLRMSHVSSFYVYRSPQRRSIRWANASSIIERYGPQHLPLTIAGVDHFDLRIHRIDPANKAFWPFPGSAVAVDESKRPPGPGEEPPLEKTIHSPLSASAVVQHIRMLGSPHYSEVVDVRKEEIASHQTLDLKPTLTEIAGKEKPGAYLVGFRRLDGSTVRHYVKVLITDLCLSTVESKAEALFAVTSLRTGEPVPGAIVEVEGLRGNEFETLYRGTTNADGQCRIPALDVCEPECRSTVKRVVVRKNDDMLVLDTRSSQAPPSFADNHWYGSRGRWLEWVMREPYDFSRDRVYKSFLFAERPVHRPEEKVYLKGYLRSYLHGTLSLLEQGDCELQIRGPSQKWTYPLELSSLGSFAHVFDEGEVPTGEYHATLIYHPAAEKERSRRLATASFRKEAYRIPRFEVRLHGPDKVPNDQPFSMNLTASYYAGGKVIDCPVQWRVNAYPYTWQVDGWDDYLLSSDSRYGTGGEGVRRGAFDKDGTTDEEGFASVVVQPNVSPTANPVKYVIEGTVTDVDEQTVTDSRGIVALPPFVLGLKTQRYVRSGSTISAQLAAIGIDGKAAAGHKATVSLKKLSWSSFLQETDFARSKPRYITQKRSTVVEEREITTGKEPLMLTYTDREPGVYVFDISATDKLGRLQTLRVDLFLAGDRPVTWQKAEQSVFATSCDKDAYVPGDRATVLLRSPYQNARALAVVELPDGRPAYEWIDVSRGQGSFTVDITAEMTPRMPVSFLLFRPRIAAARTMPDGGVVDPGKPQTVANTTWLTVKPVDNRVTVEMEHERKITPGTPLDIDIQLKDWRGNPLSGEVTLWLVDRAVLALGEEADLDPVPHFLEQVSTHISMRDSRNMVLGRVFAPENPGGDEQRIEEEGPGRITVRKNFKTVPYYNPRIMVGGNGKTTVTIDMPDNLTDFAVRAVAVSGTGRFGVDKSVVSVRLPVIVQPSLPRFVRVGDTFRAGGTARIVEGSGGPGAFSFQAEGLSVTSKEKADEWNAFAFPGKKAHPLRVGFRAATPGYTPEGRPERDSVTLQMAVRKKNDRKGDAFRVSIPLLPDRPPVTRTAMACITPDSAFSFPAVPENPRANTLARKLLVSQRLPLLATLGALRYLIEYPHGCTEQQVSRAHASLAYQEVWRELGVDPMDTDIDRYVNQALAFLAETQDDEGLFAYWPGGRASVYLTAHVTEFLVTVREANRKGKYSYAFPSRTLKRSVAALKRSLRSDYTRFIDGYAYFERCAALHALACAGEIEVSYLKQLAAHGHQVDALSQARILKAMLKSGKSVGSAADELEKKLWAHTVFKLREGNEVFGGLQQRGSRIGAEVHANEIGALAGIVSALTLKGSEPDKVSMMAHELVTLGTGTGWGNTHVNALSLLAIRDRVAHAAPSAKDYALSLSVGGKASGITYEADRGMLEHTITGKGKGTLALSQGDSVYAKLFERYVPESPGSEMAPAQDGFVVKRRYALVPDTGTAPPARVWLDSAGQTIDMPLGSIVEEHVQVVNPTDRHYVAVVVPLAAGTEFLNPALRTTGPEAQPRGKTSNAGTYQEFLDHHLAYYFDRMPSGTYDFFFRTRATIAGTFTQPAGYAEMMYNQDIRGNSPGARVKISGRE